MGIETPSHEEILAILAELKANLLAREALGPETDVMLMDYNDEYLRSKLWAKIKRRVLKRDEKVCRSCGGYGSVVHHLSYEREVLEGNADQRLATVCAGCHDYIHFADDGTKRPEAEWEAVLLRGRRETEVPEPVINLRLKSQPHPPGWSRMTSRQHERWVHLKNIRLCERHIVKGRKHYERTLQELLRSEKKSEGT